jgi:hypothetical protein
MHEGGLGSWKIAQRDGGKPQEQQRIVIVRMEFQFAFEFQAGLRISFITAEFQDGVAKQSVSARIIWFELDGFTKFGYGGLRKMANGIRAAYEHVQSAGISHGVLQMPEPLLRIGKTFGFQVSNSKKVGSLKIFVHGDGGLQLADGSIKISAVEVDSPKHILRTRVTWVSGDDRLRELPGFLHVSGTKCGNRGISHSVSIIWGELERFVKFARSFIIAGLGNGKITELPKTQSDGLLEVTFGSGKVSGSESGFGGFEIALEDSARVIGRLDCRAEKCGTSKEKCGPRTVTQRSMATPEW